MTMEEANKERESLMRDPGVAALVRLGKVIISIPIDPISGSDPPKYVVGGVQAVGEQGVAVL